MSDLAPIVADPLLCEPWLTVDNPLCTCTDADGDLLTRQIMRASELLYLLSGRQFAGVCTDVARPTCLGGCATQMLAYSSGGSRPIGPGSEVLPARPLGSCTGHSAVSLPGRPIRLVSEVKVDGEVLDASAYRIDRSRQWLVRIDGGRWVAGDPEDDPPPLEITYVHGRRPPLSGQEAAAVLACEFVKACTPGTDCKLPARLTSVVREGVSFAVLDSLDFLDKGRTGVPAVDTWLVAVNPGGLTVAAYGVDPADYA